MQHFILTLIVDFILQEKIPPGNEKEICLFEIVKTANLILRVISQSEVLASIGSKTDKKDVAANKKFVILLLVFIITSIQILFFKYHPFFKKEVKQI